MFGSLTFATKKKVSLQIDVCEYEHLGCPKTSSEIANKFNDNPEMPVNPGICLSLEAGLLEKSDDAKCLRLKGILCAITPFCTLSDPETFKIT